MNPTTHTTRRQLGELAAMQAQTDAAERRILEIAEHKLDELEKSLASARTDAMTGGDQAKAHYADLIHERGRLNIVIANARKVLQS
jgi:hypothetical protein